MLNIKKMISKYNYYEGNDKKYILIHGTGAPKGTDTARNNAIFFNGGNRGASAHYFVDDNEIFQVVEDFNGSWSCGDGGNAYGINNQNTIAIEMCCTNYDYSEATIKNTIDLVKNIQLENNISNVRVLRHYDASRKSCPEYFNKNGWARWHDFINKLTGEVSNIEPSVPEAPIVESSGVYLNLHPHMTSWAVYPMNKKPIKGNQCGNLSPAQYSGLSYKIIEDRGEVKVINTGSFGTVQIYAPKDNDSSISSQAKYDNTIMNVPVVTNKKYLNLHSHNSSWRVYEIGVSPVVGNECGSLDPEYYGGLSYEIIEDNDEIKIINTSTFGKVQIYAPKDNDSCITVSPIY